jgi:hypothetical protein
VRSLQARGRPEEAAGEVRALLDLLRENEAAVHNKAASCQELLRHATLHLKLLDPEVPPKP